MVEQMRSTYKAIGLVLLFVLVAGPLWAAGAKEAPAPQKKLVMAMVTNQSGLGDQSFNDAAWEGLAQAEKTYGIERKVLESREQAQYVPNLSTLAEQKASLIIGVGFMIKDAVAEAAKMFPGSNFVLVDGFVDLPNVASIYFKENEGAFLVGVIAAKVSKTGKIGFVGEEMATPQYNQGADVIFQVAGQTGLGVINAAKKMGKFVIGVDRDQNYLAPTNVLTSMIKRVDIAVLNACGMVVSNSFKGGQYYYGLKEKAVDFATTGNLVPADVITFANMVKGKILSGEIKPPSTYDELSKFVAPKL